MPFFKLIKSLGLFFLIVFGLVSPVNSEAADWQQIKDKHFVVFFNFKEDSPAAGMVLRKAEEYYAKIANQIGYSRYTNFWTWDDRVKIIIFADHDTFVKNTGQPEWSQGYSNRDSELFHSRIIVTYRQEEGFLDGLLPHEIGHLILRDFIGFETKVPLWFEEGVAQLQESNKKTLADQVMQPLAKHAQLIPFDFFMNWDIRKEQDSQKVSIYYLQSVSVVDFMIKNYGSSNFGYFCRSLKEGKNFVEALRFAYTSSINSLGDLEKRWVEYLSR